MDGAATMAGVDADQLLLGPRGRRLCHEVARAFPDLDELDEPAARAAMANTCTWATYWQEPYEDDIALAADPGAVRGVAEMIAASATTAWWTGDLDLDDQHAVRFPSSGGNLGPPAVTGLRGLVGHLSAAHAQPRQTHDAHGTTIDWRTYSGAWWSSPITFDGPQTTRATGIPPMPWRLDVVEDEQGWTHAASWPVRVRTGAQVLELRGAQDWVELVRRFPLDVSGTTKRGDWWKTTGRDGAWAMPDWSGVADEYDGVHLTVAAYLTTAGRALPVDDRTATVLAGWDPDETFWLADVIELGEPARWAEVEAVTERDPRWVRMTP